MLSGIYEVRNNITDSTYIGSAINLDRRRSVHFSLLRKNLHPNIHLQRAWNKYGNDSFEFNILLFCRRDVLIFYEQRFLDTITPAYNLSPTANSNLGTKYNYSKLSKIKSGISRRGVPKSEDWRIKHHKRMLGNQLNFGKKRSEETKVKMHRILLGNKRWLGRKHTEEAKEKIRCANQGRIFSAETRQKMRESAKIRWHGR